MMCRDTLLCKRLHSPSKYAQTNLSCSLRILRSSYLERWGSEAQPPLATHIAEKQEGQLEVVSTQDLVDCEAWACPSRSDCAVANEWKH